MGSAGESAEGIESNEHSAAKRGRTKPPPGPPVYVQDFGYTIGIEKKRREAREAWERMHGDRYEETRRAK